MPRWRSWWCWWCCCAGRGRRRKTGWALVGIIVVQALVGIAQFRLGVPRWSIPIHVCLSSVIVAVSSLLYAQGWARPALDQDPRHTTGSPSGDGMYGFA